MGFACDSNDGNLATLLLSNPATGDTIAACPICAPSTIVGIAAALGIDLPVPGVIELADLVSLTEARQADIEGMKGSGPVKQARLDELQTVITAVMTLAAPAPADDGTQPALDGLQDDPDGPGGFTGATVDAAMVDGPIGGSVPPIDYGDDPPPY